MERKGKEREEKERGREEGGMFQNHLITTVPPGINRSSEEPLLVEKRMGSQVWVPLFTAPHQRYSRASQWTLRKYTIQIVTRQKA